MRFFCFVLQVDGDRQIRKIGTCHIILVTLSSSLGVRSRWCVSINCLKVIPPQSEFSLYSNSLFQNHEWEMWAHVKMTADIDTFIKRLLEAMI